ncbi:hypothetical protein C7271_02910 [filamentous cyanobacterium CCP5]|nr:hypothetical protein C7271_02910 [filamentous cyanobacterium CCP5]
MDAMKKFFSVYLSEFAVELRDDQSEYFGDGRLICSQKDYGSLLKFAKRMAFSHQVDLHDYTTSSAEYQY